MGFVAVLPRLAAIITRKHQFDAQGEITRFEAIMRAQDARLAEAEAECQRCENELRQERADRLREREYFFRQIAATNERINECHGIMRRMGWIEPRKEPRTTIRDER